MFAFFVLEAVWNVIPNKIIYIKTVSKNIFEKTLII